MGSQMTSVAEQGAVPPARGESSPAAKPVPPRESPIPIEDLIDLRQGLMQRRVKLVAEISRLQSEAATAGHDPAVNSLQQGQGDAEPVAEDPWAHVLLRVSIDRKASLLHEIDEALLRIQNNTYGYDEATGDPIPLKRLRETPWARSC